MSKISLEYYLQGAELQLQERFAEAILSYQRVLRFDSSVVVLYSIGECYNKLSQLDLALEFTEKSLKKDSTFLPAMEHLAEIKVRQEKYSEAIEVFERVLLLNPNNSNVLYSLAGLTEFISPEKAQKYFKQIVEFSGFDTEIVKRYGNLLVRLNKEDEYIALMKRHYEIHPDNAHARALLIEAYSVYSQYEEAFNTVQKFTASALDEELEDYYQTIALGIVLQDDSIQYQSIVSNHVQALTTFPSVSWKVLISLAVVSEHQHLDSLAAIFYRRAERLVDSSTIESALGLGYELLRNRKINLAKSYLQRYSNIFTSNPRFPFLLAMIELEKDDNKAALSYLQQSIKRDSNDADSWAELGSLYSRMNDGAHSDKCFEKALSIDPKNPLFNNNYAYSLCERDTLLQKAFGMSTLAIELDPENASYIDTYAWILFKQGKWNQAINYLQQAIRISEAPSGVLYYHLSEIYKTMKDLNKAIQALQQAIEIEPHNADYTTSLKQLME